jgi:LL-diaminopimelate aminotransferase
MLHNPHIEKLSQGYLFPEIEKRKQLLAKQNPNANLISLSIGDTSQPIPKPICESMSSYIMSMSTVEGYSGYGSAQSCKELQNSINSKIYNNIIDSDDIFISDGSKCDLGRLQIAFGNDVKVAIQNPAYPVYIDSSVILGMTENYDTNLQSYKNMTSIVCSPENNFLPNLDLITDEDVIFFCHPNNPTGVAYSYEQLEQLVDCARKKNAIIVFDTAYAQFIQSDDIPRSIYEIPHAQEVAIEIGSFSKFAGFTGLRLGWSIVPKQLPGKIRDNYKRVLSTFFNGASKIVQAGGLACLEENNWKLLQKNISFYQENARILKTAIEEQGITCFGGSHAPFLWAHFPDHDSWELFDIFLKELHLVPIPGEGFGACGKEFLRLSAFGSREDALEAAKRLKKLQSVLALHC